MIRLPPANHYMLVIYEVTGAVLALMDVLVMRLDQFFWCVAYVNKRPKLLIIHTTKIYLEIYVQSSSPESHVTL